MEGARKTSFVIPSVPGALLSFAAETASKLRSQLWANCMKCSGMLEKPGSHGFHAVR